MFTYQAFGLAIASDIEYPELLPGKAGLTDVYVRCGPVPEHLENAVRPGILCELNADCFLLNLDGIARYLVCAGSEILVDTAPEADPDAIRLFLLGPVFGALLHQRGILPLHGSAISTPKGAVLFVGLSGCGKSKLAAAFRARGYQVLADELCALTSAPSRPLVQPAYPRLLLWADVLEKLGLAQADLRPARSGLEKYQLLLGRDFAAEPVPIYAVYLLRISTMPEFSLSVVEGAEKTLAVMGGTYQPYFLDDLTRATRQFAQIGNVARHARLVRALRWRDGFQVDRLADLLESDFSA